MAKKLITHSYSALKILSRNNTICTNVDSACLTNFWPPFKLLCKFCHTQDDLRNLVIQNYHSLDKKLFEQVFTPDSIQSRGLFNFFKNDRRQDGKRKVPKLILLQNPITWILLKLDFSVLRNIWDPSFEVGDFKIGTKQAISRVTQVISEGQYTDLNGLLTKPARMSLMRELDRNWNKRQRSLLALERTDIQISAPRKVYFIRIADKKFCDVDMSFLALKWVPISMIDSLVFTEIFARFHREYTPHCIPEWTIAYFKITRFQILRR